MKEERGGRRRVSPACWMDRPCRGCAVRGCPWPECQRWREWFARAWSRVNRYAWEVMDRAGRERAGKLLVALPHEDPCRGCPCSSWCDKPCAWRLLWWDRAMERLRNTMAGAL